MNTSPQLAERISWRDFWICETGTDQQVAHLHELHDDDDDDDDDDGDDKKLSHDMINGRFYCSVSHRIIHYIQTEDSKTGNTAYPIKYRNI